MVTEQNIYLKPAYIKTVALHTRTDGGGLLKVNRLGTKGAFHPCMMLIVFACVLAECGADDPMEVGTNAGRQ